MIKDKRLISPEYSKSRVKKAGDAIRTHTNTPEDEQIIENWRASHNHILNTWLVTLVNRVGRKNCSAVVGQRLKRKNTIYDKLSRGELSGMSLERMHDIAGCRIIFEKMDDLESFRESFIKESRFYHEYKTGQHKNYIENPKDSGYRGIHDVYAYKSDPRRPNNWNGLLIELQYRTKYQHAWATAVEVADIIKKSRTKYSDVSNDAQNQFFKYASEIIARAYENMKSCCPDLSDKDLIQSFNNLESQLNLLATLKAIKVIHKDISGKGKRVIIIRLHIDSNHPDINIYTFKNATEANKKLFELENTFPDDDIVMVRADQTNLIGSIQNVFRNYFTDAGDFVKYLEDGIKKLIV